MLERVKSVFPSILSRKIEGEVNEVLLCSAKESETTDTTGIPPSLSQAAKSLQSALCSSRSGNSNSPHIQIAELLKDLKVE